MKKLRNEIMNYKHKKILMIDKIFGTKFLYLNEKILKLVNKLNLNLSLQYKNGFKYFIFQNVFRNAEQL